MLYRCIVRKAVSCLFISLIPRTIIPITHISLADIDRHITKKKPVCRTSVVSDVHISMARFISQIEYAALVESLILEKLLLSVGYWKSYYNYKLITGLGKSKSCSAKQLIFYEKSYYKATFDGLKGAFEEVDIDHTSKVT